MGRISIKESIEINTNAEMAWNIIGPNFVNISDWGRGINKSWGNDTVTINIKGAPSGGRFCDLGKLGIADERILHYSESLKEITWSAQVDKMPGFVKELQNALKVEPVSDTSCIISTNISADLTGLGGLVLAGQIKKNFAKLLKGFVKDWKVYAETGEVSEAKKQEIKDKHAL